MTNHEKLRNILVDQQFKIFTYETIKDIADKHLTCPGGKYYACLKFLQEFCNPTNVSKELASNFKNGGDPRKFNQLNVVKKDWKFAMTLAEPKVGVSTKFSSTSGRSTLQKVSSKPSKKPSSRTKILANFSDELVDKLVNYIKSYASDKSLSKIYQWSIDKAIKKLVLLDVNSSTSFNGVNSPFVKSFILRDRVREILKETINEEIKKQYIELIVSDWGGISTGNINNLLNAIENNSYKFDGIASRSKYYSFNDPENYAIYDARVIYSLNWLLLKYNSNTFFPDPSGRNTLMNPLDYTMDILVKHIEVETIRNEIVTDIDKRNNNPNAKSRAITNLQNGHYIKKNAAYLCYCELLKRLANKLYGDPVHALTKTEMILFAIADKDIALDVFDHKYKLK
jgi:hypothetical protein